MKVPDHLVSTHHALFHFPGEVFPAGQVSNLCLSKSRYIHSSTLAELL